MSLFFLTNTHQMISYVRKPPEPVDWLTGEELMNSFLSLGILKSIIIYLICGILISVYFRDKKEYFSFKEGEEKAKKYFEKNMFFTIASFMAIFTLFIVKLILFVAGSRLFSLYGKLTIGQVILFFFIYFSMVLMINSIVLLANMFFEEKVLAMLSPLFFIETVIVIFGITSMFLSERLSWLGDFLNFVNYSTIDKLIYSYVYGYRVENLDMGAQVIYIVITLVFTVICTILSYIIYKDISRKGSKDLYYYEGARVFWYVVFGTIICYLIAFTVSAVLALFQKDISIEKGKYIFNIAFMVSTPLFIILEYTIYKLRSKKATLIAEENKEITI
ncbi:hypothetical protein [Clostridium folliculivorans]|uniref:Uncharacterized protein n=1 Tax=Clostridium folliculivorans TaxID=2886038 RepID=A0A9W5Y606_9CLOT|nr:hypothetical protein [Clostridium folliculivorans]GKU27381.1 hypothetical protein CFOLD11_42080 [Clostridium folliculivorans]GKU32232.1 hypothetical protein CFB3_43400 [Clostridium folliculivorans]